MREETLPGDPARGELVFYQLGKFSQVISDYEQIHFTTEPAQKYEGFAKWLEHQAPDYYADADADVGYATPDAVVLSTVHQAKGMQWPAVFVPCLRKNRFPSTRQGGLGLFHVIPDTAIADPDRYRGTVEDETRLFYVAVTRAQKYLFATFSPAPDNRPAAVGVLRPHRAPAVGLDADPGAERRPKLEPQPKHETPHVTLSFSELKYLFECPYQFKLRFLYGFNAPLHEALGYGKGLHDALPRSTSGHSTATSSGRAQPRSSSTATSTRRSRTPRSRRRCAPPRSRRSSATSTEHGQRPRAAPSTARSRSRSTSRPASPSTAEST